MGAVSGGKLYDVGGFNGSRLTGNFAYTPGTDRWTSRGPSAPATLDANGAGVINGQRYIPGGSNGEGCTP